MKHNSYVKVRFFERLIAEIEQSVEQMEDNDLERIIFMCWGVQQSRREDVGTIQNVWKSFGKVLEEK